LPLTVDPLAWKAEIVSGYLAYMEDGDVGVIKVCKVLLDESVNAGRVANEDVRSGIDVPIQMILG
jgi:hypothetical protein